MPIQNSSNTHNVRSYIGLHVLTSIVVGTRFNFRKKNPKFIEIAFLHRSACQLRTSLFDPGGEGRKIGIILRNPRNSL